MKGLFAMDLNWRDHVDRMGQDRWTSWANTKTRASTDPQKDRLKDGEGVVRRRQKRTDTDKQEDRVIKEEEEEFKPGVLHEKPCGAT
jgi:hypothetical protein